MHGKNRVVNAGTIYDYRHHDAACITIDCAAFNTITDTGRPQQKQYFVTAGTNRINRRPV